jgi:hypothetical protein
MLHRSWWECSSQDVIESVGSELRRLNDMAEAKPATLKEDDGSAGFDGYAEGYEEFVPPSRTSLRGSSPSTMSQPELPDSHGSPLKVRNLPRLRPHGTCSPSAGLWHTYT